MTPSKVSASFLREIIKDIIYPSIKVRRSSISNDFDGPSIYDDSPSEKEITDFILSNQLYSLELVNELCQPLLLGLLDKYAEVSNEWVDEFIKVTKEWSETNSWLGGDEVIWPSILSINPFNTNIWTPSKDTVTPNWAEVSPSYLLLAKELIEKGGSLSKLNWRDFENLIGHLLEKDGWNVTVTKASKDGGIDVIATKYDENIGVIKSVWQAKKYGDSNPVRLNQVRELYSIRENSRASKAIIVTTNRLTKDAIEWVKQDEYRFGYKQKDELEDWIKRILK